MEKLTGRLVGKAFLLFSLAFLMVAGALFLTAGTLDYWEAWVYCAALFLPPIIIVPYLLERDPELMQRRLRYRERVATQKTILAVALPFFIIGFLIPGFDHRYGWSHVPAGLVLIAAAAVALGYFIVFLAFRENTYASRIINVEKGQKTITTGPYSVVRHPMYSGVILMYTATPIALGSYWALPAFLLLIPAIVARILNEEKILRKELPGYKEYCRKTRYRLIPFVW